MPSAGWFGLHEGHPTNRENDMGELTLSDIAEKMKDIDFCMLTTVTDDGTLSSRPMSNNRDVDYDGDSWFFAYDDARFIQDVRANDQVGLTFAGDKSLLGKPGIFIAVEGKASLITDRLAFEEHWIDDMERWFPQGIETPGIALLKVHASRVHYWDGEEEGKVKI
jgi:general stress protein 26